MQLQLKVNLDVMTLLVEIHEVRQVSNKNNVTCREDLMGQFIMPLRQAFE